MPRSYVRLMLCQACHQVTRGAVCTRCRIGLRGAPEVLLEGGRLRVVAAFAHEGAARRLVHNLKYGGLPAYADLAARMVAPRLPRAPIVPVPRAWTRRLKYGVDPAEAIAMSLSGLMGVPVLRCLERPIHRPQRAGGDHSGSVGRFGVRSLPPALVLVDDVVTTGSTILAAARSVGLDRVRAAAAANIVTTVSSLSASWHPSDEE